MIATAQRHSPPPNGLNRAELVHLASATHGFTLEECGTTLEVFLETVIARMMASAAAGGIYNVEIRGFGTFFVRRRRGRPARNPTNGDLYAVPDRWVFLWRPTLELRRRVNGRRAA